MVIFISQPKDSVEELEGNLGSDDQGLMHSVLEADKQTIDDGKLAEESINRNIGSFTPDMMFDQLVKNYQTAKKLFGEKIIRLLSNYDPSYTEKNIRIPEFQRELKKNIEKNIKRLKKDNILDTEGFLTEKAISLASLVMYTEELDKLQAKGLLGEKKHEKKSHYGEVFSFKNYAKGDRYKDISLRKTIKKAIKRGHKTLSMRDLVIKERVSRGKIHIIYGIDASGSMKGNKIEMCKKAGIALAFKALEQKDKVGLVVFGKDIKDELAPTTNFSLLLKHITKIRASKETDFTKLVEKAIQLFPPGNDTKHLVILTDAMPTVGKNPKYKTLKAISAAKAHNISISLVGIQLDKDAIPFAEEISRLGEGRLYLVKHLQDIDAVILHDYYATT